jgi:two-component system, NarL family, sensor histidine kinase BarA
LLMGRGITNPITQLMVAVNKVEKGHLDIHIDTGASGELKSLEVGINNMVRALSLSREELETKIDKATEDLRIVLEDLAQKNKELESSRLDAENANREKSAFLANISHEIRTPLHGAKGFMQLMSETKLQDEQKLYLDRINSSIKALSSLLNDILDFSRLEVSKLKLEYGEFDVSPLLDDIVTMYAWEANEKEIELVTIVDRNIPLCLYGSGDRISQVLRNLVSNAVKYTAEGEIIIRLEKVVQAGASQYRFSVTDTGIGIPPEERGRLFQPFSQIESGMRKNYGGVGLGLVISKALVELMGGRIYVNSIEDVGTCFSVELCLHACDASAVKAASFESAGSMPCWILSPNDNIQASLLQTFLRWGAQAETGGALPSNHERLPQLICASKATTLVIVDGLFSDTRIMAFLKLLEQRTSGHRAVPVLLETANGCAERERLCRYFNYRLTRPLNSQEVETLVRRVHETGQVPGWIQPSPEKAMHQIALDHFPENILLVDDNVINREFLDIWMSKAGIAVDQAKNGIEAIKACEDGTYGLILMDLHMPGMDGFQAIEAIKSGSTANRNSRIIAITADATEETIERIGATGFDGYLIKPVTQESLLAALSEDRVDRPVDIQSPQDTDRYSVADSHIVDEAEGLRLASGNRDIWRWSLKTLAQRLPDYRERLRLAVENREHEELSKVLHAIQGAASYCGAMDLLSAINRLQTKVKDEQNMEFSKEYSAFLDSMTAFINWVSQQELE